jgi:hypothetical protein
VLSDDYEDNDPYKAPKGEGDYATERQAACMDIAGKLGLTHDPDTLSAFAHGIIETL